MRTFFCGALAIFLVACSAGGAQDYDLVILNGRAMDPETEFDAVRNVGIKDGRIATITEDEITGVETIDASGHVVTAGFIDTHTHSSDKFAIKMAMMDGVTTGMDYELGGLNIGAWYDREEGKWPINYGQCVSHEMVRIQVHDGIEIPDPVDAVDVFVLRAKSQEDDGVEGWSVTVSNLDQINTITEILDENLRQGALCIGTTPGYAPTGISTYEMFEVQKAAARYGRPIASHTRFHGSTTPPVEAQMGFNEIFTNAALLDAPLLYSHNNEYGWWEIEEKLSMAREKGMNMWSEYYPYEAASTAIGAVPLQPDRLEGNLGLKYEDVLYDPTQDKFLTKDEYLQIVADDPGRTVIAFNPARKAWLPTMVADAAHGRRKRRDVAERRAWLGRRSRTLQRAPPHVRLAFDHASACPRGGCTVDVHIVTAEFLASVAPRRNWLDTDAGAGSHAGRHGRRHRDLRPGQCAGGLRVQSR